MEEREDGTRYMTQKGLIEKTIETTKMTGSDPNVTSAIQILLGFNSDGKD